MDKEFLDFLSILDKERMQKIIELIDAIDVNKIKMLMNIIDEKGNIKLKIDEF